jgi:CheY-like chemotaxis protein
LGTTACQRADFEGFLQVPTGRPSVLLIGPREFHEFAAAVAWLRSHTELDAVGSVTEALDRCASQPVGWHCVVICQSRPGQFSQQDIDRLNRALPLSHHIALLGSCCEGETRSGRPWPGVVRVYWHQWLARGPSELRSDVAPTSWQLPRTSSDAERVDFALRAAPTPADGLIAIYTGQAVFFQALARACRIAGYSSVWTTTRTWWRLDGAAAVLWHAWAPDGGEFEQLRHIATSSPRVPVVALFGFPRHDHVRRAKECGAAAVLSVPFLLPDLWNTLRELAP